MQIRLTRAVKGLSIACLALFLIQQTADQFFGTNLAAFFGLVPYEFAIHHRFWQIATYAFLHGDVMHIVLNLLMLVFIGSELEAVWGTGRFLRFYFFCAISAGAAYLGLQFFVGGNALHTPMVGASGAIYGLLLAYGILFGERVLLFMMLFPMKAKHFIWILAGVEFMSTVYSRNALSSVAHLSGMGAGFVYLWVRATYLISKKRKQEGSSGRPKKKRRGSEHLKLVIDNDFDTSPKAPSEDDEGDDQNPKTWH